ncbi:hypothetical protein CRUP_007784, partial [Coryphaenoides rupestris]
MNTIRQVPTRVKSRRVETNLGAEREHFDKQQLSSISKAINSTETPGNLHDKYGQLVALYSKLLCTKLEFHVKHSEIRPNLEVADEVLERAAGTDINNVFQLTVEVFDYLDTELRLAETVLRQLNTSIAISTLTAGQCRLSPLIQVVQDCSHLYHFTDEPQDDDDDEPEPLIEVSDVTSTSASAQPQQFDIFDQTFGPANGGFDDRDQQIEGFKRDVEMLRVELERVKAERYITQLKSQINSLEAELEEQRAQKQRALVENEQPAHGAGGHAPPQRRARERAGHSADTEKILTASHQTHEEVERTKMQMTFEMERLQQEADMRASREEAAEAEAPGGAVCAPPGDDYLISRAEATLGSIDKVTKGHKDFAIRMLVLASTDLQKEIVEGGRGAATMKEFYARNSRWTEGLISASKAVGWGATQMVPPSGHITRTPRSVPRPVPQSPPNFLHAASLAKHVKPVVVIPNEDEPQDDDDDEPEPLIEVSDVTSTSASAQPQ